MNSPYSIKDVRRLDQLRADKVCPERRESSRSKDFPRRAGLYVEVASRRTPWIKVAKQRSYFLHFFNKD